jgi:hypothetical protein
MSGKIFLVKINHLKVLLALALSLIGIFSFKNLLFKTEKFPSASSNYQLPKVKSRYELGDIMQSLNGKSMIEIGVRSGEFAAGVLPKWPSFEAYYGIDPWRHQTDGYTDPSNGNDGQHENNYLTTQKILKKYGDRIHLIRSYSLDLAPLFQDKSIDFIYIDARHDYCSVLEDLMLYYPKLKCGGVMAGHDFITAPEAIHHKWGICSNGTTVMINGGGPKGEPLFI